MTQDATTKQTTPNRPGITRPVFCCSGSGTAPESSLIFSELPASGWRVLPNVFLYTVLLSLAKRPRVRVLDRWQGYVLVHLRSIDWGKCGALDDFDKCVKVFNQYQDVQSNHCYVPRCFVWK